MNDQFEALIRMEKRWEVAGGIDEMFWRDDARNYVKDTEVTDLLLLVNNEHTIQWMADTGENQFYEGMSLENVDDLYERINQSLATKKLEITQPVRNKKGEFIVYMIKSISHLNNTNKFLIARINIVDFFNKVLITPDDTGFYTQVNVAGVEIFHNNVTNDFDGLDKKFEINLDSDSEVIDFRLYPTNETLDAFFDFTPEIIWVSGIIFSFLFYWTMLSRIQLFRQAEELATEVKQKQFIQKKLEHMAHFDSLTNVPNRYLLSLHLDKHISQKNPMWLLYLDLDMFKDVNDTLGHGAGDQLLIELSRRFEEVIETKDFIARMGGDEFVLVFDGNYDTKDVTFKIKKLLQIVAQPFYFNDELVRIGASVGAAHYPGHCDSASELITHADTALRYVKGHGRHNFKFYDIDLAKSSQDRLLLLDKIKKGIKNNEFELVYQPRVDIKTGKYWGAEALIRWSQKDGSLLTPKVFLQILEDSGLIVSIGWQVLETALDRFNQLLKYNSQLKLSYNVSAKQLESPHFVEDLLGMLKKKNFPVKHFELELTEQTLISDLQYSKNILLKLKSYGVTIAIDDFGTGYSSLSYLKNFPVDVIKIDKSFVKDIAILKDDYELINAIISMGKNLKVKVVAEGIETLDQLNILSRLGCDEAQGYYFNKPTSFEVFKEIVAAEAS